MVRSGGLRIKQRLKTIKRWLRTGWYISEDITEPLLASKCAISNQERSQNWANHLTMILQFGLNWDPLISFCSRKSWWENACSTWLNLCRLGCLFISLSSKLHFFFWTKFSVLRVRDNLCCDPSPRGVTPPDEDASERWDAVRPRLGGFSRMAQYFRGDAQTPSPSGPSLSPAIHHANEMAAAQCYLS